MKRLLPSLLAVCAVCAYAAAPAPKGLLTAPLMAVENIHATNLKLETADDGTRYVAVRLRLEGAPAVRVYISGMQLALGQKLIVSDLSGTQVYGPYEFAGPTESGEFWSEPVQGSEIILELQTGPNGAADLPFKVEAIQAAELSEVQPAAAPPSPRETMLSVFRGAVIEHEVVDGNAIYEGDILLGPANELPRAASGTKDRTHSTVAITGTSYRWPNGRLPYVISSTLPNQTRVTAAIAHWNTVMAGVVTMVPRTTENSFITFNKAASSGTCSSYVGKTFGGAQPIEVGDACSKGNIIHEIGHAWGVWHEHTREDRNSFVAVHMENIQDGLSHNFTQNISSGDDIGAYDYNSIMHYNAYAFSKNGAATIVTIPAGIYIGQRNALSTGDIAGIKALYPSAPQPPPTTVAVSVTANPVGAPVSVDGVQYAAPALLTWTIGSTHTIAAVNSVSGGMRVTFAAWSDSGAQSHTVTASTSITTFRADYAVAYSVKATTSGGGSVTFTPVSADTFYVNGTSVAMNAAPPNGSCFAGWTGLIAGTPRKTNVVANRFYDLQAGFQTGAITLTLSTLTAEAAGGTYSTGITATSGCLWSAAPSVTWIRLTSPATGSGSATVNFTVDPNPGDTARTGTIVVETKTFTVTQPGVPGNPPPTVEDTATFVGIDTTTSGSWKGVYGAGGFNIFNHSVNYPSYVTVTPSGFLTYTWSASTSDVRGLKKSSATAVDRFASCLYSASSFNLDIAFKDESTHRVSLYVVDWDRTNRRERIEILDADNNVLDSRSVSSFIGGQYITWNITGHVTLRVSRTAGMNAVASAIFFN